MRASDFVEQLAIRLPSLADDFTTNNSVSSLTRVANTVTVVTTEDHNLAVGEAVNISGAFTPISISSIDRVGIVATLITDSDHDFTETIGFLTVEIEGATESEFNGSFKRLRVLNRRTITFQVDDSGPTSSTGSPLLLNGSSFLQSYNGLKAVLTVPTTTSFTYNIEDSTLFTPASGTIVARKKPRISAAVTYGRILQSYTKQQVKQLWLFIVMGDGIVQKNRRIEVDSTDNLQKMQFFNQRITQAVTLYLFSPTTDEIAARDARDRAEELLKPICQSILLSKFDTLLSCSLDNPLQFNEHGAHDYNTAFYVHRYTFEATLSMSFEDTVGPDEDVAFRDISMTIGLNVGTETFDTSIDLDDEPLP